MKYLILILILIFSGCAHKNVKSVLEKTDKGKLAESGFFLVKEEKPLSLTITATGNANVNMGDTAIEAKTKKEIKKIIKTKEAWDMTLRDAFESYSSFALIFIGLGLIMIVYAIKRFESTSVGRVFGSVNGIIANKLKHSDPKTSEFVMLQSLQDEIEVRSKNHLGKG